MVCEVKSMGVGEQKRVAGDQNYQLRIQQYGFVCPRHGVQGQYHDLGGQ